MIIPLDYTNNIRSIKDTITGLFDRLLTLDEINSAAYTSIPNEIYAVQEQFNGMVIPLDYSSDI
jgi:hypothetical protein